MSENDWVQIESFDKSKNSIVRPKLVHASFCRHCTPCPQKVGHIVFTITIKDGNRFPSNLTHALSMNV